MCSKRSYWGYGYFGTIHFSSGTSLKCCIVGCYGLVIFTIKVCLHSNFGATLFGFKQYTTKIYTELDIFDFMSLYLLICVFSSFYFDFILVLLLSDNA